MRRILTGNCFFKCLLMGLIFCLFFLVFCLFGCAREQVFQVILQYSALEGGYIEGETFQRISEGEDGTAVEAVAFYGYRFLFWSDGYPNAVRTDVGAVESVVVYAQFERIASRDIYVITYEAAEGGSIVGHKEQRIYGGESGFAVGISENLGYVFAFWSDGLLSKNRVETDVWSDIHLVAYFAKKNFTLSFSATEGGTVLGDTEQVVLYGEQAREVVAVPDVGYRFVRWDDDNMAGASRMDIVQGNITAKAIFALILPDGRGTAKNPFVITTPAQLQSIKNQPHLYYKLGANIDLSGQIHQPIFAEDNAFSGIFDGVGYKIQGMKTAKYQPANPAAAFDPTSTSSPTSSPTPTNFSDPPTPPAQITTQNPSLFGAIGSGVVRNLYIEDFSIEIGILTSEDYTLWQNAGAVAGVCGGVIENVHVRGVFVADGLDKNNMAVGGIAGRLDGTAENCSADVQISVSNSASSMANLIIGGLVGGGDANILASRTSGQITTTNNANSVTRVGGMIGYLTSPRYGAIKISDSKSDVNLVCIGSSAYVGGFFGLGQLDGAFSITRCEVYGAITSDSVQFVGGFAARMVVSSGDGDREISGCSVVADIVAPRAAGFVYNAMLTSDDCKISYCSVRGSMNGDSVWGFFGAILAVNGAECYRNYTDIAITASVEAAGFADQLRGVDVEQCFARGSVTAGFRAAGFALTLNISKIFNNCYARVDLTLTNDDQNADQKTSVAGFIYYTTVSLTNCYYTGKISGTTLTQKTEYLGITGQVGAVVADFVGVLSAKLTNCYLITQEPNDFSMDFIVYYSNIELTDIDLTIYNNIATPSFLANRLNQGQEEEVWKQNELGEAEMRWVGEGLGVL